jgi:hypothetical protein
MANAMVLESAKEAVDMYFADVIRRVRKGSIAHNTTLKHPFKVVQGDCVAIADHIAEKWDTTSNELGCLNNAPNIDCTVQFMEQGMVTKCVVTVLYAIPHSGEDQNKRLAQMRKDLAAVGIH